MLGVIVLTALGAAVPALPGGQKIAAIRSDAFLKPPPGLGDVFVASTPPTVDFMYYPGQTYPPAQNVHGARPAYRPRSVDSVRTRDIACAAGAPRGCRGN